VPTYATETLVVEVVFASGAGDLRVGELKFKPQQYAVAVLLRGLPRYFRECFAGESLVPVIVVGMAVATGAEDQALICDGSLESVTRQP
jgi:hypothetical protein